MDVGETLRVESVEAWRGWLAAHHADRREIWLINDRKGPGRRTLDYDVVLEEAVCYGWIDGLLRRIDDTHYVLRWTPRRRRGHWSPANRDRARRLAAEGRMTGAGLAALPDDLRAELAGQPARQ